MDGTALYECAGVLFIAQALGIDLTAAEQFIVVITALLASVGAAGIPSAGLVMLFIVTNAVGLNSDSVALWVGSMLAIDRPLDMFRTMVNITSDSVGAAVIAKSEGEPDFYIVRRLSSMGEFDEDDLFDNKNCNVGQIFQNEMSKEEREGLFQMWGDNFEVIYSQFRTLVE